MRDSILSVMDRVCVVAGTLLFMQAPAFFQQYLQRLGGHMRELEFQVAAIEKVANAHKKSLQEYINYFQSHTDGVISTQGEIMNSLVLRYEKFKNAFDSLFEASLAMRPFSFFYHFKADVVGEALHHFEPGITFSAESVIYGAIGGVGGYFLFSLIKKVGSKCKATKCVEKTQGNLPKPNFEGP